MIVIFAVTLYLKKGISLEGELFDNKSVIT